MSADWVAWVSLAANCLLAVLLFAGRNWLRERIVRAVQFRFDARLEEVRAELRKGEEDLKSKLRAKEAEIAALRDGLLSGRLQRLALVDERRVKAVENTWAAIMALAPYRGVSGSMSLINLPAVEKAHADKSKLQKFFGTLVANIPDPDVNAPHNAAHRERPFLSPLAWALFSAYSMIVLSGFTHAKMLSLGMEDTANLFDVDGMRALLRAALPSRTEDIERLSLLQFHALLEYLESELLNELRKMLDGLDSDRERLDRAAALLRTVTTVTMAEEERRASAEFIGATAKTI